MASPFQSQPRQTNSFLLTNYYTFLLVLALRIFKLITNPDFGYIDSELGKRIITSSHPTFLTWECLDEILKCDYSHEIKATDQTFLTVHLFFNNLLSKFWVLFSLFELKQCG